MKDNEIVALYIARDETAIDITDKKYGSYCFVIANNLLGDRQDAEECVNDAYLKTWNAIPPAQPQNLKIFLGRITRNLALDRFRANNRVKRGGGELLTPLDEVVELVADTTELSDDGAEREFVELLSNFLKKLSVRERNIFIRRYFYFDSAACIAEMLGLRESNVNMILSRTRKKLRELLRKEGYIIK